MRLMKIAAVAALGLVPALAHADDDPKEAAIEARQGYFLMLGANMGTLAGMAKGEIDYDEAKAVQAASNIEALAKYDPSIHFIEGTSMDDMKGKTGAKAEIWSDAKGFGEKYAGLQQAATGLTEKVKGGKDAVGPAVAELGKACKACHDGYRGKE